MLSQESNTIVSYLPPVLRKALIIEALSQSIPAEEWEETIAPKIDLNSTAQELLDLALSEINRCPNERTEQEIKYKYYLWGGDNCYSAIYRIRGLLKIFKSFYLKELTQ